MALELQVNQQIGLLDWNFEQLNQQLDVELRRFDGLVITEDEIKTGKAMRASLNNLAKAIEAKRREVKDVYKRQLRGRGDNHTPGRRCLLGSR